MICFLVSASVYLIVSRLFYRQNEINLLSLIIKVASFIIISCGVLYWNAAIAKWVEDAALYIPHITKIYLLSIASAAILYRGIFLPLKLKISLNQNIRFKFLLKLCLDLKNLLIFWMNLSKYISGIQQGIHYIVI